VVDAFTLYAASGASPCVEQSSPEEIPEFLAMAAVSFLRCLCAFGFPLFAEQMYQKLGYGKGDTLLAVVAIVIGCPS
jgi:hypothetical protein